MTDREPPSEPPSESPADPTPAPPPPRADDTLQGPLQRLGDQPDRDLARQAAFASISHKLFGVAPAAPRLGAYSLGRMLGHGGMGVVHQATGPRGEQVAIKTLRAIDPAAIERLKHEFRSVADLHHPNLVTLHELGHETRQGSGTDEWFIVMELVPGVGFDQHLRPPVDEASLRDATIQLVRGLHTLHRAGRLHRDLKPGNVLVTPGGRVVILDFGLVHAHADPSDESHAGTPAYMSPEQARGEALTPASDWYSLGVLLHEALTGAALASLHPDPRSRPAPTLPPSASPALAALCVALLDPDPRARPDARAIARALARDLDDDDAPADHIPLLGRSRELAELNTLTGTTATAILLEGSSGVGKSALLAAFLRTRSDAGDLVLRARCYEHESVPYKAVDALVDALTTHLRSWPPAELAAILPPDFAALTRIFPVLARLTAPQSTTQNHDPQETRRLAFRALRALLAAVARARPLVLAIDDLQWGDLDSARLLLTLLAAPEPPPCLWIGACRREDRHASPFLAELARGGLDPHLLTLEPLAPADAEALARALLHARGDLPDAALITAVAAESEGSPLFVEALIRQHSGRELPLSLDHALQAALERVDPPAQTLLQLCAVAGQPLARPLLAAAQLSAELERAALQQLRTRHLLRSTGDRLVPYHDRIREVVLRNLEPAALRTLHLRLALTLEHHDPGDPERLAFHFHAADDDTRAGPLAAAAADRAFAALAFDRAATLYAQALAWTPNPQPSHTLALTIRHAESLVHAGRCGDAAPRYLAAAELTTNHNTSLELRRKAAEQYLVSGHLVAGLGVLRPLARDQGLPFPETPGRAKLRLVLDAARFTLRGLHFPPKNHLSPAAALRLDTCGSAAKGLSFIDPLRAATFAGEHLRRCLAHGDPALIARALAQYALLDINQGTPRLAARGQARIDHAHHLAQKTADPQLIGVTTIIAGVADLNCGRWRRALGEVEAGITLLGERRVGVTWERSIARAMAMHALTMLGDFTTLATRAAAWLREAEELGDRFACVVAGLYVGHARLADADLAGARQSAARARALWAVDGFHFQHWLALGLEVACDLADAKPHAAWRRIRAVWPAIVRSDLLRMQIPRIDTLGMRAHAALALAHVSPDRSSLLRTTAAIAASLAREHLVHARAAATSLQAGLAVIRNDRPAARHGFARAAELYLASDMPVHAACVQRRLATLGDPRALRDVDDTLRARGVRDPASFAAIHVAGA